MRVLGDGRPRLRTPRRLLNGLAFGGLAVGLAVSRIQVAPGVYFDARNVPVALIALFEGWPAGAAAAVVVAVYRWLWLGGAGTIPGVVSVLCAAAAGSLVHEWATRHGGGRVRTVHALALGTVTFLTTLLGYMMLGHDGLAKFGRTWPHFLVAYLGGITLLAQLFQNILERERLYVVERRFRALLDETSEAIRIVDAGSHLILESNRADAELAGSPREHLRGRDTRDSWPADGEGRARWEALDAETARAGAAAGFGLPFRSADGAIRAVDLTCRRVEHDGRRYDIVILRDAGPREALDAARREVSDLRAITLVANAAAHEINNPLTVIVGSLELLQRRLSEGQETRWIDRAVESSQRIREIISRMTHITRVEASGQFPGVPAMLDIRRSSDDNEPPR